MSGLQGYDQWKTASPYDDEIDLEATCPKCGSEQYVELDSDGKTFDLECDDCGHKYTLDPMAPILTDEQKKQLDALYERLRSINTMEYAIDPKHQVTLEQMFGGAPEGDFVWDDTEAGDWFVYACDESDCEQGWHKEAYFQEVGRTNGKRWVRLGNVDEDGNSEIDQWWDESEGDTETTFQDIAEAMAEQRASYFYGWAEYYLSVAETGRDVIGAFIARPSLKDIAGESLTGAERHIETLEEMCSK